MSDNKALAVTSATSNVDMFRASTDAATMCKAIVVETAKMIGDRKYVQVEGWQAIAVAHGCTASARSVECIDGGVRAIGEIRRMSDGAIIAEAEGFVGEDEPVWYGGTETKNGRNGAYTKVYPKRAMYAIRAMAQTRAISRACRSAFAHVVVMMNAGLSTTPAEEVPEGGFTDAEFTPVKEKTQPKPAEQKKPEPDYSIAAIEKTFALVNDLERLDNGLKYYEGKIFPADADDLSALYEKHKARIAKISHDENHFDEVA